MLLTSPRARTVHALREFMQNSGLRCGERLPTESKLAERFDVSRMTLRSALEVLEREGLVRRQRNVGCICTATLPPKPGLLMSRTIVLITDHLAATNGQLFSGLSESVVSGVIDRTSAHGTSFLRVHADTAGDQAWLDELIASAPLGVVVSLWNAGTRQREPELLSRLAAAKVPVVAAGEAAYLDAYDRVASDHVGGTEQLVAALAAAGKRRVLRLWTPMPDTPWIQAHNRGYERATRTLGLESLPAVHVEGLPQREPITPASFRIRTRHLAGYLAEHLHSDRPIDAIMLATDCEALAALAACRLFRRTDIAVTGYDNYWRQEPERQWEPAAPFATVDKSNHRMGEEMVELLLDRVNGKLPPAPQQRIIEQRVVSTS